MPRRWLRLIRWDRETRVPDFTAPEDSYSITKMHLARQPTCISPFAGYVYWEDDLDIGVAEMIGRRPAQEDTFVLQRPPEKFLKASLSSKQAIIQEVLSLMNQSLREIFCEDKLVKIEAGSTAVVTALFWDDIQQAFCCLNASIGDSLGVMVKVDRAKKQVLSAKRINVDHNFDLEREQTRVTADGGSFYGKRLKYPGINGGLAITRALGDFIYPGLSEDPDFVCVHTEPDAEYLYIHACDGLNEPFKSNFLVKLKEAIESNWDWTTPDKLAMALMKFSYDHGSGDNITVLVAPLDVKNKVPRLLALFDGHAGDEASEMLKDNFTEMLHAACEENEASRLHQEKDLCAPKEDQPKVGWGCTIQ